ncbi:MAG TPA: class I mannose-6-phosphate isomerase [Sphingomicrobium sp.]|nr:class I mannose-6-phosphate isomerase [Sphingomicrobium sp.]
MKLTARQVEKPWGRRELPAPFINATGEKIGEIWFEHGQRSDLPFLTKYIFTSERLSVQVHPDDMQAAARGNERGKTECWFVIDADPGAEIGLGLARSSTPGQLRSAAIDGSVMDLLNWRKVAPGDFFHVPAGTVHAIGAGVSLLEFQQNSDITYRLYDYGRPRELHLDDAIDVASLAPYSRASSKPVTMSPSILHSGDDFTVVKARSNGDVPAALNDRLRWVMPIAGKVRSNGDVAEAGECLLLEPAAPIRIDEKSVALIAAGGAIR